MARRDWRIGSTAAELLRQQMPRLLAAATATGPLPPGEEIPAPEPVGNTLVHHARPRVLVDSTVTVPPEHRSGVLLVGFTKLSDGTLGAGAVKLIQAGSRTLEPLPVRLTDQFPHLILGRWARWDDYQPVLSPAGLWRMVEPRLKPLRLADETGAAVPVDPTREVLGLLVPSETGYRQPGEEWLFVLRHRAAAAEDASVASSTYEFYRSAAAGAADVAARTPTTTALRKRRVLLVGLGALGGTVATELARAGPAHLDLVDGDSVDPATACRQLAPVLFAGFSKVTALRALLQENNPHVEIGAHTVTIGAVQAVGDHQPDAHAGIAHLIRHADLVIDTAADPSVSRLSPPCGAPGCHAPPPGLAASADAGPRAGHRGPRPGRPLAPRQRCPPPIPARR